MNLNVWEDELERVGLLQKFQHIIDGFDEGFHQGIPYHTIPGLRYFSLPNHSSASLAREEIEKKFRLELEARRMFGPFEPDNVYCRFGFFRTSPLGAVVNNDGLTRPINNLSFPKNDTSTPSVNSYVDKHEFETTWDDFNVVANFIKNSTHKLELGIFDWAKAYWQIPTAKDQWKFLIK